MLLKSHLFFFNLNKQLRELEMRRKVVHMWGISFGIHGSQTELKAGRWSTGSSCALVL
jgi:hypothetical protein